MKKIDLKNSNTVEVSFISKISNYYTGISTCKIITNSSDIEKKLTLENPIDIKYDDELIMFNFPKELLLSLYELSMFGKFNELITFNCVYYTPGNNLDYRIKHELNFCRLLLDVKTKVMEDRLKNGIAVFTGQHIMTAIADNNKLNKN